MEYPPQLPITQKKDEIAAAIAARPVVIVCGETGSGKTTQLPKICLEMGRGQAGRIGHTQPRRIAARSVATRIAQELNTLLGELVGYKVRFSDKLDESARIKLMTDGILLAETQTDRDLRQYDTLIIDEAHERSLNIDFLLGYVKNLLPRRPDLKLIITSATIDPERFSRHFNEAPIIMVSGRMYPVETLYRPLKSDDPDEEDRELPAAILEAVDEAWRRGPGDILVFLAGEREIRQIAEALRKHHPPHTEILPLYARLSTDEQMHVFEPHGRPRIILATNIAETSLTVPGIRYVIDPGTARISRYNARGGVQRLLVEPISRASADQRLGRCGRVAEGVCIRLYSQEQYESRPQFTDPEILRTSLASVILQMKALRLGDIGEFPFLDPPSYRHIRDGYQTLHELGAIDEKNELTDVGRALARLPVDVRLGRMILAAGKEKCVEEILVIASALAVQDPRLRPIDAAEAADAAHTTFRDGDSDFLAFLRLWRAWRQHKRHDSSGRLRSWCKEHFLSYVRLREWEQVHTQLAGLASGSRDRPPAAYGAIHRAILAGLLSHIGQRGENGEYQGPRGQTFFLFPGSALFKRKPPWVMAAERVQTTRVYGRTLASIQPHWIERAAGHLVRRNHGEVFWDAAAGHVMAYEQVTLWGLSIIPRRAVRFGPIDAPAARRVFIQSALVEGQYRTDAPFFAHNRQLMEQLEQAEAKTRREVLAGPEAVFDFYDRRVPPGIYSAQRFEEWRRHAEKRHPRLLFMSPRDLMRADAAEARPEDFPAALRIRMSGSSGDSPSQKARWEGESPDEPSSAFIELPLSYHLEPGHPEDGITATVPLATLGSLPREPFDWLVPGMLVDLLTAIIRTLPRSLRVKLVPAPQTAQQAAANLTWAKGDLRQAAAWELGRAGGVDLSADDIDLSRLPSHLRMNFRVIDSGGQTLAQGRDLDELRRRLGRQVQKSFRDLPPGPFNRGGLTSWDFGDLPADVPVELNGVQLAGYPALVDEGESAGLRLFPTADEAQAAHRGGVRRLFMLENDQAVTLAVNSAGDLPKMELLYATLGPSAQLRQELALIIADRAFLEDRPPVRTHMEFMLRLDWGWNRLLPVAAEAGSLALSILEARQQVLLELDGAWDPAARDDVRDQLDHLVCPHFLTQTPWEWLKHVPRFLRAMLLRLQKRDTRRERRYREELWPLWQQYKQAASTPTLERFRWLIEEARVALFAQELRTSVSVSVPKLRREWEKMNPS